jgi:hypothetical protein
MAGKAEKLRQQINKNRETSFRPIFVHTNNKGGVEKEGMARIFEAERAKADQYDALDGAIAEVLTPDLEEEVPPFDAEDIVFLDPEDIPDATEIAEL